MSLGVAQRWKTSTAPCLLCCNSVWASFRSAQPEHGTTVRRSNSAHVPGQSRRRLHARHGFSRAMLHLESWTHGLCLVHLHRQRSRPSALPHHLFLCPFSPFCGARLPPSFAAPPMSPRSGPPLEACLPGRLRCPPRPPIDLARRARGRDFPKRMVFLFLKTKGVWGGRQNNWCWTKQTSGLSEGTIFLMRRVWEGWVGQAWRGVGSGMRRGHGHLRIRW